MTNQLLRSQTDEKEAAPDYRNPDLSVDRRVADLLSRMTIQEKVAQMLCVWGQKKTLLSDEHGNLDLGRIRSHLKDGVGQIGRLSDTDGGKNAQEMAELANTLQQFFVEQTRLGIPVIFHEECLHGLAAPDATSYPQPIGLASTFNPELIEQVYTAIAEETRSRGAHQALTPVVDVARDPRWGRVEETFGEDPYLVSRMGIAAVRGFQGDATFSDKKRVIATLKHFAAHGQPESGANCGPGECSPNGCCATFFCLHSEKCLKRQTPAASWLPITRSTGCPRMPTQWLLRDVLRREWGFKGYRGLGLLCDHRTERQRGQCQPRWSQTDKAEAAILAVNAGVNIELPDPDCYPHCRRAGPQRDAQESLMDELVAPMLQYKFRLGLFEDPYVRSDAAAQEVRLRAERALALQAAQETISF